MYAFGVKAHLITVYKDDEVSKRDEDKEMREEILRILMQSKVIWFLGKNAVFNIRVVLEVHMRGSSYI